MDNGSTLSATPRVKICGIMDPGDALAAAEAGADFLGYIFYSKSARNMAPSDVRRIVTDVRARYPHVRHVGVLVNETAASAERLVREADLDLAQLHGDESPETVSLLRSRGVRVVKAFRFGAGSPAVRWNEFEADYFLCDTFSPASAGGTGEAFDHALLPPDLPRDRMFLAGGLAPENVARAVRAVQPFAVDVSSGVEQAPGRKLHDRIAAFIREARQLIP